MSKPRHFSFLWFSANTHPQKVAKIWRVAMSVRTEPGFCGLGAWLLRPLFRKADIDRHADAVEELVSGGSAMALSEATCVLAKCGDIERLLSRVHSMSGTALQGLILRALLLLSRCRCCPLRTGIRKGGLITRDCA